MNYKGSCHCGRVASPYAEANDPKGNATAAINIRCLEGIDLAAIPVKNYDGRSL